MINEYRAFSSFAVSFPLFSFSPCFRGASFAQLLVFALFIFSGDLKVRCKMCRHLCVIANGRTGICNTKLNENAVLKSMVYGVGMPDLRIAS